MSTASKDAVTPVTDTETTTPETDAAKRAKRQLARALFVSDMRAANEEFKPSSDESKAQWEEKKKDYGKKARLVMRRLSTKGYSVSKS